MTTYTDQNEIPLTMSVKDVAKALNISLANAYILVNSKEFPKLVWGKRLLIPKSRFLEWVKEHTK